MQPDKPALDQKPERITVTLIPKAAADLRRSTERDSLSKTDIVNRALSLYEHITARLSAGSELLVRDPAGQVERISFF